MKRRRTAYGKEYYQKNKERILKYRKEYTEKNKEKIRASQKEYQKEYQKFRYIKDAEERKFLLKQSKIINN